MHNKACELNDASPSMDVLIVMSTNSIANVEPNVHVTDIYLPIASEANLLHNFEQIQKQNYQFLVFKL